jgi:hypothetical protein
MDIHNPTWGIRGYNVLHKLSDEIAACYQRALACRNQSELTRDPRVRHEFIELEREWLKVIEGLEFAENLDRYLRSGGRYQEKVESK